MSDFNELAFTATLPWFWALYLSLAVLGLGVAVFGLTRLIGYIRYYGSEFSLPSRCPFNRSRGLVRSSRDCKRQRSLTSNAVTAVNVTAVIGHLNYWPLPDTAYFGLFIVGPLLMVFSTILVGLFWSAIHDLLVMFDRSLTNVVQVRTHFQ